MRAIICKDLQLFPNNNQNSLKSNLSTGDDRRTISISNNNNSSYNIHVDSRVVRGNTFASTVLTTNQRRNKEVKEREDRRRRQASDGKVSSTRVSFHSHLCIVTSLSWLCRLCIPNTNSVFFFFSLPFSLSLPGKQKFFGSCSSGAPTCGNPNRLPFRGTLLRIEGELFLLIRSNWRRIWGCSAQYHLC